ncbi:hypothetical protein MCOR07_006460 [Pyricularia oryzae]|nr:hypothetical protein MCOR26_006253 [Pyricularia oryzae]KAI6307212.1 hypothetical protein MCOR29_009773 [Pyricularia oryzae]KAI6315729.1 hypothetical protein MCOR34_004555 [Pyricularia oryzae]KAI6338505.1 hypothetical protein MCOR28_007907 [Pyricularia oryzae]KAI6346445.1 hypothetical protein MCOR30_000559 [Pyricularia oryzae]
MGWEQKFDGVNKRPAKLPSQLSQVLAQKLRWKNGANCRWNFQLLLPLLRRIAVGHEFDTRTLSPSDFRDLQGLLPLFTMASSRGTIVLSGRH